MRTLEAVIETPDGGFRARVALAFVHESKASSLHALRVCCEYLGFVPAFPRHDREVVIAKPHPSSGVADNSFYVEARWSRFEDATGGPAWVIEKSSITG